MFCSDCGNELKGRNAQVCPDCGADTAANAPGKGMLMAIGILYVVFACIGILLSLVGLLNSDFWDEHLPAGNMPWAAYYAGAIVLAFYELYMGIMAIKNRTKLHNASILKALAIIAIVLLVAWNVISVIALDDMLYGLGGFIAIFSIAIGLIFPILYFVGANKNRKAYLGEY